MNLTEAVQYVSSRFVYRPDRLKIFDSWRVMKETDGKLVGDCDDFAITVFWQLSNNNLFVFLFHLLITHRYRLYNVRTIDDEPHIVGSYKGIWFDNITRQPMNKDQFFQTTDHQYRFVVIGPITLIYLAIGLFLK